MEPDSMDYMDLMLYIQRAVNNLNNKEQAMHLMFVICRRQEKGKGDSSNYLRQQKKRVHAYLRGLQG